MEKFLLLDSPTEKRVISPNYNLLFDKKTGFTARWGKTKEDNPQFAPFPEILDIEISDGKCGGKCPWCYKANNTAAESKHMTLETFQRIMDKMKINGFHYLNQIALGLTDTTSNPDFWNILDECKKRGIAVNLTTHGLDITDEVAKGLAEKCGAVAVSVKSYNKDKPYDAIKKLSIDNGMSQVNIHFTLSRETLQHAKQIIKDIKTDPRLSKLNAIVFLSFKDKQETGLFTPITVDDYKDLIEYCNKNKINYGFDSCAGWTYLKAVQGKPEYKQLSECVESCCAGRFSSYINVDGYYFPCSFTENCNSLQENVRYGFNVISEVYPTFLDIWNAPAVKEFRQLNISCEEQRKNPCKYNFS